MVQRVVILLENTSKPMPSFKRVNGVIVVIEANIWML